MHGFRYSFPHSSAEVKKKGKQGKKKTLKLGCIMQYIISDSIQKQPSCEN